MNAKGPLAILLSALVLAGCATEKTTKQQAVSMFVGVDVSGSFIHTNHFDDSLEFLSHYIYGHLNATGDLHPAKTLFVGSIGGQTAEEAKSFHPIEDFQGKTPDQILADLKTWFKQTNQLTDFTVFFKQVADIAQKRNLSLSPIVIVLLTDGVPDVLDNRGRESEGRVSKIDMQPLEFLSRNITVRLLYPTAPQCSRWEHEIDRKRVRLWTADDEVMAGWKSQLVAGTAEEQQDKLWKWVSDNVDFRVRPTRIMASAKK